MKEYADMNVDELKHELKKLRELFEEVTEEREMMLFGTTGLHRSVAHLVEKYANELAEIAEKMNLINSLLEP